jgi:diacylglycerol kinase
LPISQNHPKTDQPDLFLGDFLYQKEENFRKDYLFLFILLSVLLWLNEKEKEKTYINFLVFV